MYPSTYLFIHAIIQKYLLSASCKLEPGKQDIVLALGSLYSTQITTKVVYRKHMRIFKNMDTWGPYKF